MPDQTTPSAAAKTPWHLWLVGVISLLWNAIGALDFTMTMTRNEAYMKQFTPEQLSYFYGFPAWLLVAWGLATWGGLVGSGVLLARRRLAVTVYLVSLVGMAITFVHNFVLTDGLKIMGGPGALVFTGIIVAIAIFEYVYSRAMAKRSVLR